MAEEPSLTRAEMERRLRPYRCRQLDTLPNGSELWISGWGVYFFLFPETDTGLYDEWQYAHFIGNVVTLTMPVDWPVHIKAATKKKPK